MSVTRDAAIEVCCKIIDRYQQLEYILRNSRLFDLVHAQWEGAKALHSVLMPDEPRRAVAA